MRFEATTLDEYVKMVPEERQEAIQKLRKLFKENLPSGFEEELSYGMITFSVPHSIYPKGYHCDPKQALPFISIASQKNFIAIYHMGIYANPKLLNWFVEEFPKHSKLKLDMGKSCIRFKKVDQIPYNLLADLATKITVQNWIYSYENAFLQVPIEASKTNPEITEGDTCKVLTGTHKGKIGTAHDLNISKSGQLTLTIKQAEGTRFKTLGKSVEVIKNNL